MTYENVSAIQLEHHKRILDRVDENWSGYCLWIGGMWGSTNTIGNPWVMIGSEFLYADERVDDGQWHHIVTTYDAANLKLFIDGRLVKSKAATKPIPQHAEDITIGNISDKLGGTFKGKPGAYDGLTDDVRLYNRALSDEEILSLFNSETEARRIPDAEKP